MLINKVDLLLCIRLLNIESKAAEEDTDPKKSSTGTQTTNLMLITQDCFLYSPVQCQCFPVNIHLIVTKQRLSISVMKSLDVLLRQDLEDQGGLEDLVDHLHHLCLVDLVDPGDKTRIIK